MNNRKRIDSNRFFIECSLVSLSEIDEDFFDFDLKLLFQISESDTSEQLRISSLTVDTLV